MRIGRRVTRITATAWALMLAALLVASAAVVHVGFREVEDTQVTSDASRVIHAIEAEVVDLDRVAADWANWDDMYAFVRTRDRRFIASNLMSATFDTLHVHAIAVLDSRGTRVWDGARTRPEEPIVACPPTLYGAAQAGGPLSGGSHRGVMALDDALWLVAAHPIRRSNRTGPPRGTVIFARRLGNDQAKALSERLLLSVQVEPLTTGRPSPELVHQIGSQGRPVARVRDLKTIEGYGLVAGIGGEPVAMVRVDRPRVMFRQALRVVGLIAALFAVLGAGAGIAYMRALRRSVLARVEALDRQVRGVDPSAAAQPTIGLEGDDELADLAASVGEMLARVTEARTEAAESRMLYNLLFDTMVQGCVLLEATPESDGCKIVAANAAFERMAGATAEELEGRAINDVLPGLSDGSKERLRNVARSGSPDRFEDHIAERGMYVEITAFRPAEQRLACIITDVTARRQSDEELRANEERAHRLLERQTAVSRLAVALGGARDLRSIYAILHEHVRALVETSSLVVARVDAERGQAVAEFAACGGAALDAGTLRPLSISDDRQTVCQAIRSNVPVYVADILSEAERDGERPAADAHSWLRDLIASGEADCDAFRSVLCVPMAVQGQTLGAIQISGPRPDSYTRDDVEALAGVATLAGVAIVNVRLIDESNRARRALLSMLEDHRRTERSLRESEARFATAFRLSPEAITISRLADGYFVDVNDGFTKMTGFTRDEAMVASSLSLNIWADPKDRGRLAARLRNGENITNEEVRFRRKDGSPLIGLMSATLIELRGERCILSTVVDITERKRTNDMLAARLALHEYAATHS
ncbi:MAG: PAS domain S-box protein, partial [Chthonomonadales bacterium]|nr:PAS domain S-box protein [Chthonomonadales bacterium]